MHDELLDAGCSAACQAEYEALPNDEARLCYLQRHRKHLVAGLHRQQEKLACLDYMIYELQKKVKEHNTV